MAKPLGALGNLRLPVYRCGNADRHVIHIDSQSLFSGSKNLNDNCVFLAPGMGPKWFRKRSHFEGRIPALILGPDSGPLNELI